MEDRQLISKRRSTTDSRRWVYAVPVRTTKDGCTTEILDSASGDSPSPTSISSGVELSDKTITTQCFEPSQQIVNNKSTDSQQKENVEGLENGQTVYVEENTGIQKNSQQTPMDKGERGGVESSQSGSVLQNEESLDNEIVSQPRLPEQESQPTEEESIQIGDCIIDVITAFRGIVVGIDGERIIYECREFGRVSRHQDLVLKITQAK